MRTFKLSLILVVILLTIFSCSKKTTESDNTTVRTPKFLPASGTYEIGQYMSIQCETEDAEIRYTLDMTEPDLTSPIYTQSLLMPDFFINNSNNCQIRAKAFRSDLLPSQTVTANYTVIYENTASTPVISPANETFNHCPITVTITNGRPGTEIRYTTNGDEPNYTSALYGGPITLITSQTVKAKAFMAGLNSSETSSSDLILKVEELGGLELTEAFKLEVSGNYAYVIGQAGLHVIDVSNPAAPEQVSLFNSSVYYSGIDLNGDFVYLVGGSSLWIVDVSNPAVPVQAGTISLPFGSREVTVHGDYAYVVCSSAGLRIYDVSIPSSPSSVGSFPTNPGYASEIEVNGNYAYVGEVPLNFRVINISNPSAPSGAGTYPGFTAFGMAFNGNYAYIADGVTGMRIMNISNPLNLTEVGLINTYGSGYGVCVSGNYAYLTGGIGLRIFDVSNPSSPVEAGYCTTITSANDVAVSGNYAYVTDYDFGLRIIHNNLD